ncbi:MAG TPA: VCBS repeat-containing protein [Allosphingosinicella sp.]
MSSFLKIATTSLAGTSLPLLLAAAAPAVAQTGTAPWYKEVLLVKDGAAALDTGDGRPSLDGRWNEESRSGHAAPVFHDYTGDGLPDLIVGDFSGWFRLYTNHGTRNAPAFNGYEPLQADGADARLGNFCCTATGVRFADIDGDGVQDLTAGSYLPGMIYWFPGKPGGHLGSRQALTTRGGLPILARLNEAAVGGGYNNYAAKPAWMDWDGDGKLDLLIGDAQGDLLVRRNTGLAHFKGLTVHSSQPTFEAGTETRGAAENIFGAIKGGGGEFADEEYLSPVTTDWNGDELVDLVVATQSGAVYLLLNTGSQGEPSFAPPIKLLPSTPGGEFTNPQLVRRGDDEILRGSRASVDVADWNGDGKLDLIVGDWARSWLLRSNLSAAEESGLKQVLAKLVALDKRAGLQGEEPLRDRHKGAPIYFENEKLGAELATLEAELTTFLEPRGKEKSTRLSDFERNHGHVRVYLRR